MRKNHLDIVRHFAFSSEWNQKNLFCGWYDADLSEKGFEEATQAGKVCFLSLKSIFIRVFSLVA